MHVCMYECIRSPTHISSRYCNYAYTTLLSCVQILAEGGDPGAADATAAAAVDVELQPNRAASVVASHGVNQVRASIFLHMSCWRWQCVFRFVLCGVATFPIVSLIVLLSVSVSRARKNIPPLPRTTRLGS